MDNKEYLSEEENQRISKKLGLIGKIMMICGAISFIVCVVLMFGNFASFESKGFIGLIMVMGFACLGFGLVLFTTANQRKITAYMAQQQMPIAKESMEKMAPSAGVAAKEIAKGVKEGLKEDEEK